MDKTINQKNSGQFLFVGESQLREIVNEEVEKALTTVKNKPRRTYTRGEVKDMLHVSLATLDNMVKRGDIKAIHVGRRVLFDAISVDEAIEKGCGIYKTSITGD